MKIMVYIMIFLLIIITGICGFFLARPLLYSPKEKAKILMFGRSTMELWFKHWNWPYPLRLKMTYRPWPIPYRKYSHGKLFLEYQRLEGPRIKDLPVSFGENMLRSFESGLKSGMHEAAFFKFCFVDFPVQDDEWQTRFEGLKNTIVIAHQMTAERKMKLIIGNALPLLKPSESTLRLQIAYNQWLHEFAADHTDGFVFDFFNILSNENGRLKKELARADDDDHPNDLAFYILDEEFFKRVSDWLFR